MLGKLILIAVGILGLATSIGIPVIPHEQRCMIVYTDDNYETLKLDINFPALPSQSTGEVYQIEIINTESHEITHEVLNNGRFRRQMDLQENVIYKICLKLITHRELNPLIIDYNSDIEYSQSTKTVQIPQNLLKSSDTKNAYQKVLKIEQTIDRYQQFVGRKKEEQNLHYLETVHVNNRLSLISYVEIVIVLVAGLYQFFMIRKFLVDQQYM